MSDFVLTPDVYALIKSDANPEERMGAFAMAFGCAIDTIKSQYQAMLDANARVDGIASLSEKCAKMRSIPASVRKLAIAAGELGCSLTIQASGEDVTIVVIDPQASTGSDGTRKKWVYRFDGQTFLKRDGGKYSSIKALLEMLKDGGDKDAADALDALAESKKEGFQGWKLNGWTASQKFPRLAMRITRTR